MRIHLQLFTWLVMAAVLLAVASAGNISPASTYKHNEHVSNILGQRFHRDFRLEIKKFDYSILPYYIRRLNPPTSSFRVMTCILLVIAVFSTQTAVFKSSTMSLTKTDTSLMQHTRARGNTKKTNP